MIGKDAAFVHQRRPLIGVLCCNGTVDDRAAQIVANRFITPLAEISGAQVLIVPAIPGAIDAKMLSGILDGVMLTGSCSNVDPERYDGASLPDGQTLDAGRDAVSFALADAMIEAGKPVFGICRGFQELNVLFGGSLRAEVDHMDEHYRRDAARFADLFDHGHRIRLTEGGLLRRAYGASTGSVNSVHRQGVDRLGAGLSIEAHAHDGLIEGFSARPNGAPVIGVQWHPEWGAARNPYDRAFFRMAGDALRGDRLAA